MLPVTGCIASPLCSRVFGSSRGFTHSLKAKAPRSISCSWHPTSGPSLPKARGNRHTNDPDVVLARALVQKWCDVFLGAGAHSGTLFDMEPWVSIAHSYPTMLHILASGQDAGIACEDYVNLVAAFPAERIPGLLWGPLSSTPIMRLDWATVLVPLFRWLLHDVNGEYRDDCLLLLDEHLQFKAPRQRPAPFPEWIKNTPRELAVFMNPREEEEISIDPPWYSFLLHIELLARRLPLEELHEEHWIFAPALRLAISDFSEGQPQKQWLSSSQQRTAIARCRHTGQLVSENAIWVDTRMDKTLALESPFSERLLHVIQSSGLSVARCHLEAQKASPTASSSESKAEDSDEDEEMDELLRAAKGRGGPQRESKSRVTPGNYLQTRHPFSRRQGRGSIADLFKTLDSR